MAPPRVEAKASAAETVGSEAAEAGGVAAVAAAAEAGGVAAAVAAAVKAGGDTVAHAGSERIRRWWGRFGWPCLQRWGARAAARGSKRINHYLYINAIIIPRAAAGEQQGHQLRRILKRRSRVFLDSFCSFAHCSLDLHDKKENTEPGTPPPSLWTGHQRGMGGR